jgi:hypothetical protein
VVILEVLVQMVKLAFAAPVSSRLGSAHVARVATHAPMDSAALMANALYRRTPVVLVVDLAATGLSVTKAFARLLVSPLAAVRVETLLAQPANSVLQMSASSILSQIPALGQPANLGSFAFNRFASTFPATLSIAVVETHRALRIVSAAQEPVPRLPSLLAVRHNVKDWQKSASTMFALLCRQIWTIAARSETRAVVVKPASSDSARTLPPRSRVVTTSVVRVTFASTTTASISEQTTQTVALRAIPAPTRKFAHLESARLSTLLGVERHPAMMEPSALGQLALTSSQTPRTAVLLAELVRLPTQHASLENASRQSWASAVQRPASPSSLVAMEPVSTTWETRTTVVVRAFLAQANVFLALACLCPLCSQISLSRSQIPCQV